MSIRCLECGRVHPDGTEWCPCTAYLPFDSAPLEDARRPRVGRGTGRLLAAAMGVVLGLAVFQCGNIAPGIVAGTLNRVAAGPPGKPALIAASTCAGGSATATSPTGPQPIPGLALRIDNGGVASTAFVALSGDVLVDPDAEVRLAYSVDGEPAQENAFGPANLADHQQFGEGRMATAVVPMTAGRHTLTPYWRVSGIAGKHATVGQRCLMALGAGNGLAATSPVVPAAVCSDGPATTAPPAGLRPIPGLTLSVDAVGARKALVALSANLTVPPDASIRLAYSMDGAPAEEATFGPADLGSPHQYSDVRTATGVIPLPAGRHTITPYWQVRGDASKTATMGKRCLTALSAANDVVASSPVVPAVACAGGVAETVPASGARSVPGLAVTFDNGAGARRALVHVSGDVSVDVDAEVRLAYSVDGGPPDEAAYGSASLASHQQYSETRAVTAVIPLPAGSHTVTPYWRVVGPAGKGAAIGPRCLTVLSAT